MGSGQALAVKYQKMSSCGYINPQVGDVFVAVLVLYIGSSGSFSYGSSDWTAHDVSGTQLQTTYTDCINPLGAGFLTQGRNTNGWIFFDVPRAWSHLWVDYAPGLGSSQVTTWRVY
jgi:hypothetical protein